MSIGRCGDIARHRAYTSRRARSAAVGVQSVCCGCLRPARLCLVRSAAMFNESTSNRAAGAHISTPRAPGCVHAPRSYEHQVGEPPPALRYGRVLRAECVEDLNQQLLGRLDRRGVGILERPPAKLSTPPKAKTHRHAMPSSLHGMVWHGVCGGGLVSLSPPSPCGRP